MSPSIEIDYQDENASNPILCTFFQEVPDFHELYSNRVRYIPRTSKSVLLKRNIITKFDEEIEPQITTYQTGLVSEEDLVDSMINDDFIVKMQPLYERSLRIRITGIEKAKPRIFYP